MKGEHVSMAQYEHAVQQYQVSLLLLTPNNCSMMNNLTITCLKLELRVLLSKHWLLYVQQLLKMKLV